MKHDLERAKKLMAESSFPQGFTAKLTIPSGDDLANQLAVITADQLARIGIKLQIQPTEPGTILQMRSSGQFEMFYKLGSNTVIDPAMNIPFDFWSREEGGTDSAFSGYRNEELVKLSKAAEGEQDVAKRTAIYRDFQRIAMDEAPQLYLVHPSGRLRDPRQRAGLRALSHAHLSLLGNMEDAVMRGVSLLDRWRPFWAASQALGLAMNLPAFLGRRFLQLIRCCSGSS